MPYYVNGGLIVPVSDRLAASTPPQLSLTTTFIAHALHLHRVAFNYKPFSSMISLFATSTVATRKDADDIVLSYTPHNAPPTPAEAEAIRSRIQREKKIISQMEDEERTTLVELVTLRCRVEALKSSLADTRVIHKALEDLGQSLRGQTAKITPAVTRQSAQLGIVSPLVPSSTSDLNRWQALSSQGSKYERDVSSELIKAKQRVEDLAIQLRAAETLQFQAAKSLQRIQTLSTAMRTGIKEIETAVFHPIRAVPIEVLQEIFHAVVLEELCDNRRVLEAGEHPRPCAALRLSHVCHIWRAAALGSPRLWRNPPVPRLISQGYLTSPRGVEIFRHYVEKALHWDLEITLHDSQLSSYNAHWQYSGPPLTIARLNLFAQHLSQIPAVMSAVYPSPHTLCVASGVWANALTLPANTRLLDNVKAYIATGHIPVFNPARPHITSLEITLPWNTNLWAIFSNLTTLPGLLNLTILRPGNGSTPAGPSFTRQGSSTVRSLVIEFGDLSGLRDLVRNGFSFLRLSTISILPFASPHPLYSPQARRFTFNLPENEILPEKEILLSMLDSLAKAIHPLLLL